MKNPSMRSWAWLPLIALLGALAACSANPIPPAGDPAEGRQAEETLRAFLEDLGEGRYEEAVAKFAGNYGELEAFNPDLDPADRPALFARYCTVNGGMCLLPESIQLVESDADTFAFKVTFLAPGGGQFVLEGCCGEEAAEPISVFPYTVASTADGLQILELPPYVP